MPDNSYEDQLIELSREYVGQLPKQLKDIKTSWEHLQHINWDIKKLEKLKLLSHSLVGSGASYGFPEISTAAKLLEQQLVKLDSHVEPEQRSQINKHLSQLKKAIDGAISSQNIKSDKYNIPTLKETVNKKKEFIAIIEDDQAQANFLKVKLQQLGYSVEAYLSTKEFADDQSRTNFDLIILDVSFPEGPLEGLFWLEHIHKQLRTHCPIIITSARSDFVARMRALRAGASAYIAKPLNIDEVAKQVAHCLKAQKTSGTRLLWVDDDPQILNLYKRLLKAEGFIFEGISQPLKIIESLESFNPDIVIMDYEMPGCNGAEIVAMLRQDIRFMTLPIIFASGSSKAAEKEKDLNILGNAFLKKPFEFTDLLNSINTQLTKAKFVSNKIEQVSQRLEKDGMQTSRFFLEKLETLLYQNTFAKIDESAFLIYASLDNIDYLKEQFGLRTLANVTTQLENFLASHKLIQGNGCTIGNASYLMLITLSTEENEKDVLYKFQQSINKQSWRVDDKSCKLTLSIGALELKQNNKLDEVISKIEKACFEASSAGGDRVKWISSTEEDQEILNDTIKSLLREKSFKLVFQPIVNLETDETTFEALIRLSDTKEHTYSPKQFMPWIDSELEGGSNTLDRWLIENAIIEMNDLAALNNQPTDMIVKLASSLSQIVGMLSEIRFSMLQNLKKGSGKLIFAMPISVVMKNLDKAKQLIESLEELGCGFMVEHIEPQETHFKLLNDIGKIDFAKINTSGKESKLLDQFIIQLNKSIKTSSTIVASGIEDSLVLAHYWELGVRYFQGYFIQKPGENMKLALAEH